MTHDELMALPDVTPTFGVREEVVNGRRVVQPVQQGFAGALFTGLDDGLFRDAAGVQWMVGQLQGQRVRRKFGVHSIDI